MPSVFNLPEIGVIGKRPHKLSWLRSFKKLYGVTDPRRYYVEYRKRVIDRAERDIYGIGEFETLDDWWDEQVLRWRYSDLER